MATDIGSLSAASASAALASRRWTWSAQPAILTNPGAIAGTYAGAGAGGSFVGGGQVATLQNGNGVVLRLQGVQAGFQVSLGLGGMTLSLR